MFRHRLELFNLAGFRVRMDASWLLLAAVIVWSLAKGYFPDAAPGLGEAAYWAMAVAGLAGLAASIIIHEFAHAVVARRFGMRMRGITLFVFGGVAEMGDEPGSARCELWMALAGPAMSLVLAGGMWLGAGAIEALVGEDDPAALVATYLAVINLALALFNLVPAFPLDGGRVLRAVLWGWTGDVLWATRLAGGAGTVFALVLVALALWNAFEGNVVAGLWWLMLGLFLHRAARSAVEQQVLRAILAGEPVSRFMRAARSVDGRLSLARVLNEHFRVHPAKSFPVVEDGRLVGAVSFDAVSAAGQDDARPVATVMERVSNDNTIGGDADAAQAFDTMRRTGRHRLMVVQDGSLVGTLSLADLTRALAEPGRWTRRAG